MITALIYSNTFRAEFQLDDFAGITLNPQVQLDFLSASGLKGVFTGNRPVANVTFGLNYYFGQYQVPGYHLVNLLIHMATVLSLYFCILTTASLPALAQRYGQRGQQIAIFASLLWAIHPVQTQAVTYIIQRMTELATLFYLVSLLCYAKARFSVGWKAYSLYGCSIIAFILALRSKEIAATLPFFILVYEIYFISYFKRKEMWRVISIFMVNIFVLMAVVALYLDWEHGPVRALSELFLAPHAMENASFTERLLTESRVMLRYLSLIFYPHPSRLILDYDYPVSHSIWDPLTTLPSVLFVVVTMLYALLRAKRQPLVSYCILWFYGNLVIESVIIKLDLVFEHRLYLPSIGVIVLVALGIDRVWCRIREPAGRMGQVLLGGAGIGVLVLLSLWTFQRNAVWRTGETLWEDAVKKSPQKARPHQQLAVAYMRGGKFDMARKEYQDALRLAPNYPAVRLGLANLYEQIGDLDQAIMHFQAIPEKHPDWPSARLHLASLFYRQGQVEPAIDTLRELLNWDSSEYRANFKLGKVYASFGQYDLALREFEQARSLNPRYAPAYDEIGAVYEQKGEFEKAIAVYKQASDIFRDVAWAYYSLGNLYTQIGHVQEALESYQAALRLRPNSIDVHLRLGHVFQQEGQLDDAIVHYQAVLSLDPEHLDARNNLGSAYAARGYLDLALKEFERVLETRPDYPEARANLGLVHEALAMKNK